MEQPLAPVFGSGPTERFFSSPLIRGRDEYLQVNITTIGVSMSAGDEYRAKAAKLSAMAARERDPLKQAQFESLERSYLRLAMQADKNAKNNIVYETPPKRAAVQQQQQRQPKKKA